MPADRTGCDASSPCPFERRGGIARGPVGPGRAGSYHESRGPMRTSIGGRRCEPRSREEARTVQRRRRLHVSGRHGLVERVRQRRNCGTTHASPASAGRARSSRLARRRLRGPRSRLWSTPPIMPSWRARSYYSAGSRIRVRTRLSGSSASMWWIPWTAVHRGQHREPASLVHGPPGRVHGLYRPFPGNCADRETS